MDIKKLQALVIDALEDVKAQVINLFDTTHLTSLFDRIIVASGTSNRQTKALAASVRDKVKQAGGQVLSVEGETTGEWVLVDLGDMIVHIMQPTIRAYYRLEEIWGDKEIKLGAAKRVATASKNAGSVVVKKPSRHLTTSQPEVVAIIEKAPRRAAKKVVAKKAAAKTVGAKKATPKKAIPKNTIKIALKTPAKKTAASKTPAAKKPRVSATKTPVRRSTTKTGTP